MPAMSNMKHLLIDDELKEKLSEFHHKHRFRSESEAIRWLLKWALKQDPKP